MKQINSFDISGVLELNSIKSYSKIPPLYIRQINSPLGNMIAIGDEAGVYFFGFDDQRHVDRDIKNLVEGTKRPLCLEQLSVLVQLEDELHDYFDGRLKEFKTPLIMRGTPFQNEVWTDLKNVSYGTTLSYLEQAKRLERYRSYRAVANANGRNPFIIMVPCHRVIASNGSLGGYGAGLERKKQLLRLESDNRLDI